LGVEILSAATAFPPGVPSAEAKACHYVLENAEITCRALVDEVSAAQALLKVRDQGITRKLVGIRFLGESIESITGQTYGDWRLLILDHGSSDGSAELANDYAERDPRIRVLSMPTAEPSTPAPT